MVNLIQIYEICKNKQLLLEKLQNAGLVPKEGEYKCPNCNSELKLMEDADRLDGWRWYCSAKVQKKSKGAFEKCHTRVEFRTNTFFDRSKLNMFQIIGFAHFWARGISLKNIRHELNIANDASVDWASFCREVVLMAFIDNPEKLGGVGKTVEIDESKFGRRKYWRGHKVDGCWVFGGMERESGRIFMEIVEKRDAATLLPLLEKWVEKGTTVISDCWKAYDQMQGYYHLKVNHSVTFKDPETGAHTNGIESSWRHAKESFSSHGRKKHHVAGNLARYMFLKSVRSKHCDPTEEFLVLAGRAYNPNERDEIDVDEIDLFEDDN